MTFSILLPRTTNHPHEHSRCFDEVADSLQQAFAVLGMQVPIIHRAVHVTGPALVLAPQLLHLLKEPLPENLILYNFEQLYQGCRWFADLYKYDQLLKQYPVWDYSDRNIVESRKLGLCDSVKCELGYMPALSRIEPVAKKDVDFLLFGTEGKRRSYILDQLKDKGYRVELLTHLYGKERDLWIARSKVHLNIHHYDAHIFETVRVSYLLANKEFVISERGSDVALEQPFNAGVAFTPYENIIDVCEQYIHDANAREKIAAKGFATISARSQVPMLEAALKEHKKKSTIDIFPERIKMKTNQSIFIAIPSYKDPECINTILRIFETADSPERIRIGVCWQSDATFGAFPSEKLGKWVPQVKVISYDISKSEGANWARSQAYLLYADEDFTLLIDAHMHFVQSWDSYILNEYNALNEPDAVLTFYCPPYSPDKNFAPVNQQNRRVSINRFGTKADPQLLHLFRQIIDQNDFRHGVCYPSPFVAHHFIFGKGDLFRRIPLDPNIYFWGDEVTLSARLWTHGINIYQLPRLPAFHQWFDRDETNARDYRKLNHALSDASNRRVRHLLGFQHEEDVDIAPNLALGIARSLKDFWQFAGIDIKSRTISEAAKQGIWNVGARASKIQNQLEPAKNSDNVPGSRKGKLAAMGKKKNAAEKLICMATDDAARLSRSLNAIFEHADAPQKISVSVAWTGSLPYEIPPKLIGQAPQITVRAVAAPSTGNMLHEAMAAWNQQPEMIAIRAGVQPVQGWDTLVDEALLALDGVGVITQIATLASSESTAPARIAALSTTANGSHGIAVTALQALKDKASAPLRELEPTPLVSFDFMAATASTWFSMLPDPYLTHDLEEMVYSARLWTHGMPAYQLNQMLVKCEQNAPIAATKMGASPQAATRAQHMLGIAYADHDTALFELDKYGHGDKASIEEFWSAVGVDVASSAIHPLALSGEWAALAKRSKAKKSGEMQSFSSPVNRPVAAANKTLRIFVQIPCYRDTECQYTVKDLFEKAVHPDRIFAGICWQTIPEEDEACFRVVTRPGQVRSVHHNAADSKGANWARVQAAALYKDEDFVLMIDAHTRFVKGWDELLIQMLGQCDAPKALLSTYPAGYTLKGDVQDNHIIRMAYKAFQNSAVPGVPLVKYQSHKIEKKDWPKKPFLASTLSSNFIFAPKSFFDEVPLDPHIYFFGDDLSLMARGWTHGWDVYSPHKPVLFHLWNRKTRPQHWKDNQGYQSLSHNTDKRVAHLTGMVESDVNDAALQDIAHYALGTTRSLEQFESFTGVSFKESKMDKKATQGRPLAMVGYHTSKTQTQNGSIAKPILNPPISSQPNVSTVIQSASAKVEPFINPVRPTIATRGTKLAVPGVDQFRNHAPLKTFESNEVIVYDNFLPENVYEKLYQYAIDTDYRHINTSGNVARVWNIDNGFPLRSSWNHYYEVLNQKKHPVDSTYPLNKPSDHFIEHVNAMVPDVQHLVGVPGVNWAHYSVTSWLYPPNTGLSLHNDGAAYTGAYVYFLNKEWRIHWGGLLMVLDTVANHAIESHKKENNPHKFHRDKWLHESEHNEYAMEVGFARTIFPKRNRIVFIAPDAYHIVSKVLPTAGDNVRMTLAGFFNRGVLNKKSQAANATNHDHGE